MGAGMCRALDERVGCREEEAWTRTMVGTVRTDCEGMQQQHKRIFTGLMVTRMVLSTVHSSAKAQQPLMKPCFNSMDPDFYFDLNRIVHDLNNCSSSSMNYSLRNQRQWSKNVFSTKIEWALSWVRPHLSTKCHGNPSCSFCVILLKPDNFRLSVEHIPNSLLMKPHLLFGTCLHFFIRIHQIFSQKSTKMPYLTKSKKVKTRKPDPWHILGLILFS